MEYQKPEAEVKEFKAMQDNAVIGWTDKDVVSSGPFNTEEGVETRDSSN